MTVQKTHTWDKRLKCRREIRNSANAPVALLAYCAGVIDSDGTIGIRRNTRKMCRKEVKSPTFFEAVSVGQVTPEAVQLLKALFGGNLRMVRSRATREARPLYYWIATHGRAVDCLKSILPYLRIKQVQAENCLLLHELKKTSLASLNPRGRFGAIQRPQSITDAMEFCYQAAKRLNAVGVKNHPPSPLEAQNENATLGRDSELPSVA